MKELLQKIEKRMDDFTVKKKLYILYIFCVLLPLIITDSVVFLIIRNSEMEKQKHDMTNIANAVSYNISSVVNNAGEMAKTIYTSRYIDDFLSRKYDTSAQYIMEYQEFFKDTLLENLLGMNQIVFTMYTNNDTIVKGGKVGNIEDLKETQAYQKLNQSGETKGFFFVYDKNRSGTAEERKVVFLQKLDFFSGDQEKMLQLEFDYGNMMRTLQKMNFDNEVLICEENQIVLSNTKHGSTGSDFEELDDKIKKGYHQTVNLYGTELEVYVRRTGENAIANIAHDLPSILLLILINAILPFFFVHILNHSFTKRITELNEVFKSVDSEQLVPMRHEGGKDEIGSMIRSYNRMAARTNELIQTVYKNKLVEQEDLKETQAYQKLNQSGETKGFFFVYDKNRSGTAEERKVVFLQKLDFFSGDQEKMLQLEFDYGNMMRTLQKMNFDNEVLICEENQIVLSNTKHGSTGSDFEELDDKIKKGYHQTVNLYGTELEVYVRRTGENAIANIAHDLPSILLLILINAILPFFFVHILNHSFTKRITELNEVFKSVDSEQLVPMRHEGGKDEIGSMIRSYNRMAARTNELIQTVYKNKLVEQEMLVSRKNAELLALHSQINPHFLFNALESIRMHSILKNENETADMVEKLAVMQRQYVEWGEDSVTIEQEVEFVKAYLALQKYRFGERLSYQIEIDEECRKRKVPKLTLVTFVENACVHGIESKASPGWIFVRVYEQNELICMEIEDTGNGMEEGKRQELLENMRNADIEMLKKKGRVGIVNACLRLKMVSENKVKIDLDGEEGVGTLITIWMPLEYM